MTRAASIPGSARRRAARATAWAFVGYVAVALVAVALLDAFRPDLRDGEYGRRLDSLRDRVAENPDRPLVVVIGSSRAAMDVCPRAWEETRPGSVRDPLIVNMSRVGGGPIMNLMTLRRLFADGVRPAAVVLEYWPPLMRQEGPFRETDRIDPDKLFDCDRALVREYLPDPARVERRMVLSRLNPLYEHRTAWLKRSLPSWLRKAERADGAVRPLDDWGWLPGHDRHGLALNTRADRLAHCEGIYRGQLAGLRIDPVADRALREAVALARANGVAIALAFLPESTEFRGWYTPEAERMACDYRERVCREFRLPFIDARDWLADDELADGFHATRAGGEAFTRKLGPAIAATFAELK